jgi:hypothetical protein
MYVIEIATKLESVLIVISKHAIARCAKNMLIKEARNGGWKIDTPPLRGPKKFFAVFCDTTKRLRYQMCSDRFLLTTSATTDRLRPHFLSDHPHLE